MNRLLRISTVIVLFIVMPGLSLASDITFSDVNLETKIRESLNIPEPTPITQTDMETLLLFSPVGSQITNIEGLEHAVNLTSINFYGNQISEVTPVSALTQLTSISFSNNLVSDNSALSGLSQLNALYLSHNQISAIPKGLNLTALNTLNWTKH